MRRIILLALPALLAAETHTVEPKTWYRTFARQHAPVLRVRPGDVVVTKTVDSSGKDETSTPVTEPSNPLTGPFFIEGAEPGDSIVVHFRKMRLNRNWGYSGYRLGLFSMTPEYVEKVYANRYKPDVVRKGYSHYVPWDLDPVANKVRLREPSSARITMEFAAKPMLGCVGVAAPGDWAPTSGPSGAYGGNLDYNEIGEGARVFLPVYHPGALLFLGDGHALQGDGEPTGNGIETSMAVEFSVEVRKGVAISGPRLETATHIIALGSQPEFQSDLNRALQVATTDMVRYLVDDYKLEEWAAHLLIAFQGKYEVVTVAGTMALKIPKSVLPQ